jgi:hypothetical protein
MHTHARIHTPQDAMQHHVHFLAHRLNHITHTHTNMHTHTHTRTHTHTTGCHAAPRPLPGTPSESYYTHTQTCTHTHTYAYTHHTGCHAAPRPLPGTPSRRGTGRSVQLPRTTMAGVRVLCGGHDVPAAVQLVPLARLLPSE